jgi:hypothetical protein
LHLISPPVVSLIVEHPLAIPTGIQLSRTKQNDLVNKFITSPLREQKLLDYLGDFIHSNKNNEKIDANHRAIYMEKH